MLTAERLRIQFDYDPETGTLTRKRNGKSDFSKINNGYVQVWADGRMYVAHQLVWLHVHGGWPDKELDHINGNKSDNRIANLRLASSSQNKGNSRLRSDNTSGLKGAFLMRNKGRTRSKPWLAQIRVAGKSVFLGYHASAEAAHAAYCAAAQERFGEFFRAA